MLHDARGFEIRAGDVVEVVAHDLHVPFGSRWRVQEVFPSLTACNLRVVPVEDKTPGLPASTDLCAHNVRRVVP